MQNLPVGDAVRGADGLPNKRTVLPTDGSVALREEEEEEEKGEEERLGRENSSKGVRLSVVPLVN